MRNPDRTCYYCGLPASCVDHVIPRAVLKSLSDVSETLGRTVSGRTLTVPSCRECNQLLGDSFQETLAERKNVLKTKLRKRYEKLLVMPHWEEEELSELGHTLQIAVRESIHNKEITKLRLWY